MKNKFKNIKLGQVIELSYGKGINKFDRKINGLYSIYGANGELARTDKFLVVGEAIIVGRKGSAGEVTRISGKFWPSDVTYYVFGNDRINIDYLFYFFKSVDLTQFARGVKPGINRNDVYELEISLPSLSKQKGIVKVLDEKMDRIAEAKRLRAEVLADTEKILSQTLAEIFEEGKKKGWEEKNIKDISTIRRENNKKLLPYVGMEDIESNTGKFIGSLEPKKVKSNTFYFNNECVLYGRLRPYLNKVLMPDFEGHCSTEMFPFVPNKNLILRKYFWYCITQKSFIDQAMLTNKGARMPRADMNEVVKFKILVPPLPEQQKIVTKLDALSARVRELRELQTSQLADLKSLERAYLREAFNGEL